MVNSESSRHFLRWRFLLILLVGTGGFLVGVSPAGAATPCDSETVVPDQESPLRLVCDVLWAFLSGLDDPGVLDDEDNPKAWGMNNPVWEWQGTSWSNDRLASLRLPSGGLTGPISPRLGELTDLVVLDLSANELSGSLPAEIGRLSSLEYMTLHDNVMEGPLPPEIGELSNLVHLSLHTNQFSGSIPSEIGSLSNLQFLELGGNSFTGRIPSELGNLNSLTYLVIHSSDLPGPLPSELGQLKELRNLYLYSNGITGSIPAELGQLSSLEVLDLSHNQLEGSIPAELGNLSNLRRLALRHNRLTGGIPTELGSLVNLEILELEGNEVFYYDSHFTSEDSTISLAEDGHKDTPLSSTGSDYTGDELGLIAHADFARMYSLGDVKWHVWFCDNPKGDLVLIPDNVIRTLNREIGNYFEWLTRGRYNPTFEFAGKVEGDSQPSCEGEVVDVATDGPIMVIDDASAAGGYASHGGPVVVGGTAVVASASWRRPLLAIVAHEMGHHMGFPHSYGGEVRWASGAVYEGDNPMDLMSGTLGTALNTGTIAVNRYAAGWIDPDDVVIYEGGTTEEYELRTLEFPGTQMLVLPSREQGLFTVLGARTALRYDSAIPRQGVEVYRIDQRERVCRGTGGGACGGIFRRTKPYPPTDAGAGYGESLYDKGKARLVDHVHSVGDTFEVGRFVLEVVERTARGFVVRVSDPRAPVVDPDPGFVGRFSDDDTNVHQANIEVIADLEITVGCNPPDNDRYCPRRVVTRAQMMAFLSRALGGSGAGVSGPSRFSDVADDAWYRADLEWMAELGVVVPYEDGTFRPDEPLTRLDMAGFLVRAFEGIGVVADPEGVFSDVAADAEGAGEVEGVLAAGVTSGCSRDPLRYCPTDPVRRDQMASLLVKALATQATATSSPRR